ncbi:up-regulator of cell proliferation-like [Clupea harengus]|uniref:Up-regulator of cell proliferation-like n=1 Tax=Clupea harengus TaxID=7950 RepID=A0A8M1K7V4_CLUHA|nr:up-regulator of cell proliferation-like [Clupea harengus]
MDKPPLTLSEDARQSHVVGSAPTGVRLSDVLSTLHLKDNFRQKLTLSSVLEINSNTVADGPAQSLEQLPWTFLRKLFMSNLNARNIKCAQDQPMYGNSFSVSNVDSDAINPLDLITALFHCSDPFLQQEMVSKMSMCQFAVPLLLANCDTQQSTLMLWAMRDLVKKFRPHSLAGDRTFVEGRIVEMDIPMVSFVRLGESSLPKSQTLNKLLSNPHHHNDTFLHRDMKCGDVPRRISDGLVEVSWYLPCGSTNIDMFTQPVAIANLRGDGRLFKTQMSFLCQTSAAVFIFSDDLEGDLSTLINRESRAELFLVTNSQSKTFNMETLRDICMKHKVKENNVIIKKKQNEAEFVKTLRFHVNGVIGNDTIKMKVEAMAAVAQCVGIVVDEDCTECRNARANAEGITGKIQDVVEFKKDQLPLHGEIWKQISQLEKENCRMWNAGKNIESSLKTKEETLREEQQQKAVSEAMGKFLVGISESGAQRLYFLKWLKIQLDTFSRHELSTLKEQYKDVCRNTPQNKELIGNLDEQISNCSLGPEHFFRELGQLYECACSLPENNPARQQVQHLPALCAQMLLDGFPVELLDGDASNIPMKWIKEVLTQLHQLVDTKSKILVLTVLGVQSTGKSTLLNTMFGVQFAVSSGRCTRGAFMLLIKVSEELRSELKCDFIMVIDTEGLKSPELAALDTSYEHDNELATLVIGLSDITIINIAMENSTEMKDILQIVVHAFLRMKEVGKKPRCLFVHQNMSDMSAHDSNMRDRKKLIEHLDEMTQIAAKMERREANTKFTDVMDYNPDKDSYYIPGLWHGTPPMAPVNAGYSEAVYELKKSLIGSLKTSDNIRNNDATNFLKRTEDLWNAVTFENSIFYIRNSLVADAYTDLGTQYNTWEWSFRSEMNKWLITKETMISNFVVSENNVQMNLLHIKLREWIHEASKKLDEEKQTIVSNLDTYFQQKDGKVSLVERYRHDFRTSGNSLRQQMETSIKHSLEKAVEIREGMEKVNEIKDKQMDIIEKKVLELLKGCKERKADFSTDGLTREFEKMWEGIMSELSAVRLPEINVYQDVHHLLWSNLSSKGGDVSVFDLKCSGQGTFIVKTDWSSYGKKYFRAISYLWRNPLIDKIQEICDGIIRHCDSLISDHISAMKRNNTDYHETYIRGLLKAVDDQLKDHQISDECEASLKVHVCGRAAMLFQEAHKEFNVHNDPHNRLMESKPTFLENFLELFSEKDQCQKRAKQFTETCVKPAVLDYVSKHLGQAIADHMKMGDRGVTYNTRTDMHYVLLKQLLDEDSFQKYLDYTRSYEIFVENWIKEQIIKEMSSAGQMQELEKNLLSEIVKKITDTISDDSITKNMDIKVFIRQFCSDLKDQLVFPRDALDDFLILINAKTDQFAINLKEFIEDMELHLVQGYANKTGTSHITERITDLPSKPHELLFTRLCGCGEQCPFCGTPCEAGGQDHKTHFSSMHRPQAFGQYRWNTSKKLVTDICTTLVISDTKFKNSKTGDKWHPYKEYRDIYPDWEITGDSSTEASDYWKYVLMKFNNEFAKAYRAQPADIPHAWRTLTAEDALRSLRE